MKYAALLFPLLFLTGCATVKEEQIVPFTEEQAKALYARSKPPQAFGLTVYSSDSGPVFAGAGRLHQGDRVEQNFLSPPDSLAPVIALDGRGGLPIPALVDTSSKDNWITPAAGQQLNLNMLANPKPMSTFALHVYDEVGGGAGLAQKVRIGDLHMENVVFHLRYATGPLGPLARWVENPAPAVVLGTPFLRAYSYVVLDYPGRRIEFSSTTRLPEPKEETLVARLPLKDLLGALAVEGTLGGEPTTVLLDTAGDYELVMNKPAEASVRRLSVGDLVFPPDVKVVSSMDQGMGPINYPRVGRQLLARFKVSFDFRNKLVYFERPAAEEK